MVETTPLAGGRAKGGGRAMALAMLGLACVAVVLVGSGVSRTELVSSPNGGGSDSIGAETGILPDKPKKPVVHHPQHPGMKPNAMTAAEYEARLGRDIHGHPLPKKAEKGEKGAAADATAAGASEPAAEGEKEPAAVRQAKAAADSALPAGWEKKFDKSKGKSFYINKQIKAISWKRPSAAAPPAAAKAAEADALPAGWVQKFDKSKGKYFYMNKQIKAISWNRPTADVADEAAFLPENKKTKHVRDSRAAADAVHQTHFKEPQARNPTYEGTGDELNEALTYNTREVAAAKKYYAHIDAQREQMQEQRIKGQHPQRKKSLVQQLGDRSFFKFDPLKGSFYRYSPDKGAVAKPGRLVLIVHAVRVLVCVCVCVCVCFVLWSSSREKGRGPNVFLSLSPPSLPPSRPPARPPSLPPSRPPALPPSPSSIADTLNKVAHSARTPTITVGPHSTPALFHGDIVAAHSPAAKASPASEDAIKALTMPFNNGPALPNGDIVAARRPAAKGRQQKAQKAHKAPLHHAKGKAHLSQKKSVDLEVWKLKNKQLKKIQKRK